MEMHAAWPDINNKGLKFPNWGKATEKQILALKETNNPNKQDCERNVIWDR